MAERIFLPLPQMQVCVRTISHVFKMIAGNKNKQLSFDSISESLGACGYAAYQVRFMIEALLTFKYVYGNEDCEHHFIESIMVPEVGHVVKLDQHVIDHPDVLERILEVWNG